MSGEVSLSWYQKQERRIREADKKVVMWRWKIGRLMLDELGGRSRFPPHRLTAICKALGVSSFGASRQDVLRSMKFARRCPTEQDMLAAVERCNGTGNLSEGTLWEVIIKEVL